MKKIIIPQYDFQAIPLSPDDHLQVEHLSYSGKMGMILEGTALNDKGVLIPFKYQYESIDSLSRIVFNFQLGYSALVSLTLWTDELVIPAGDCYCVVTLVKAISESIYPKRQVLLNGYVESHVPLSFGGSYVPPSPNDKNFITQIIVPDPAAGAQFSYVVPDFTRLTPLSITYILTTDATAVNRYLHLEINTAFAIPFIVSSNVTIGASLVRQAMYSDQALDRISSGFGGVSVPMAVQTLQSGFLINSFVSPIQAGDQISDISIIAKRQTIPI